ncbi:SDR family NAD(P)-dependent oxidoreductase, partial [Escherichia coli]|nr:SDR family NAD(P)-dependent oxidoreductase [Escherichia coli]
APMKARNSGTIINISSIAGKKTFPDHAAYCGTKFAVYAISENVREEVASSNVRVTTIAPGAVETELLSHTTSQDIKDGYDAWK